MNSCGLSNVWIDQDFRNIDWLKTCINDTLKKQYVQDWSSTVESSSKCVNYRIFKNKFYFRKLPIKVISWCRNSNIKIRTCNHRLPIETGRWSNIDRHLRICTMCDRKSIGDEYHYIMECTYFSNERKILLPSRFHKNHNTFKFKELMNSGK